MTNTIEVTSHQSGHTSSFILNYYGALDYDQLMQAVEKNSPHYFDRDTMKFFNGRHIRQTWPSQHGTAFIASVRAPFGDAQREYKYTEFSHDAGAIMITDRPTFLNLKAAKKYATQQAQR